MIQTDVLIVGCGIAGCTTALELAKQGLDVTMISSSCEARDSSSFLAGGGIAYTIAPEDSPELLAQDILQAGSGLCNPRAVEQVVTLGEKCIEEILFADLQIEFEKTSEGELVLGKALGHSKQRTLYFRDHTGKAIIDAMLRKISTLPNITLYVDHTAVDLITLSHHSKNMTDVYKKPTCVGGYILDNVTGEVKTIYAKETVLATGGIGEVFLHTTNPKQARGDGIAMAFRAGARIMNMEYVQFQPTSLYLSNERRFLLAEDLRDKSSILLTHKGQPFMNKYHEAGMEAPSNIVARAIYVEMLKSGADHLWLDVSGRGANWIKEHFPNVYDYCLIKGFDMTKEPLPVVPAAHHGCGGIAVDKVGQTSLQRLRAVGEVACTGVQGAEGLTTAALLESLVYGRTCAEDISKQIKKFAYYFPTVDDWMMSNQGADPSLIQQDWISIKQTMWNYVGLVRDEKRLRRALRMLRELKWEIDSFYEKAALTSEILGLRNGVLAAFLIAQAAIQNRQSIGCHIRQQSSSRSVVFDRKNGEPHL